MTSHDTSRPETPSRPLEQYETDIDSSHVRGPEAGLAIAYGSESQTKTSKDGRDYVETLIWTDTWLKRNGRWQIIAAEDLIPAK